MSAQGVPSTLLEAASLSFAYDGAPADAVSGVTLSVGEREHVGIVGPNGAGKSTLLKLLAGILRPRAGEVRLRGAPLGAWRRLALAREMAFVPQSAPPDVAFTALEVALAGRFPHVGYFGREGEKDVERARAALARVDATQLASRRFTELSGGEQARVLVARALAQEPRVLLLDEPTAFLDVGHRLDLYDRLREENRERALTVVVVTHDLNLAAEYCDRLLLVSEGVIVAEGPPRDVLTSARVSEVYRCRVSVDVNPATGAPRVTPLPRHALN